VPAAELDALEADVARELEDAEKGALAAPWPDPASLPPEFVA
jgi:pyruvate dehydrogenase E1 component alpha subunit